MSAISLNATPVFTAYPVMEEPTCSEFAKFFLKVLIFPLVLLNYLLKKLIFTFAEDLLFERYKAEEKDKRKNVNQAYRTRLGGNQMWLRTPDDRKIEAQYLNPTVHPNGKTVLVFTTKDDSYEKNAVYYAECFLNKGYSVLCVNYAGFGRSEGTSCEENFRLDAETAYQYLRYSSRKIEDKDIIVYGRSLGSYAATYVASKHPVSRLVLDRGFSDYSSAAYDAARSIGHNKAVSTLASAIVSYISPLNTAELLENVSNNTAVTIVRGTKDTLLSQEHTDKLIRCSEKKGHRYTRLTPDIDHISIDNTWLNTEINQWLVDDRGLSNPLIH